MRKPTHGESKTRLYSIWGDMISRCNPGNRCSVGYGERGITVCDEWKRYENFAEWARNNGYDDTLTIERTDVNGNYEPSNCKWIPKNKQIRNRRNTIYVEYNGQKMSLADACEKAELPYMLVFNRIYKYKWPVKRALEIGAIRN